MQNEFTSSTHKKTSIRSRGSRPSKEQRIEAQEKFLKAFASNGNVRVACLAAGVDRSAVHYWAEHDEQFNMRYNLAKEDVNDAIRGEIYRRGMFGDERYVTSMGKVVYHDDKPLTIREKSDTLLIFHAKSRMPEYREKQQVDLNANVTGSVQTSDLSGDLRLLTNEQLAQFKAWLHDAKTPQEQ
jgi:hypothetical protein